jgi:hypothetical protein
VSSSRNTPNPTNKIYIKNPSNSVTVCSQPLISTTIFCRLQQLQQLSSRNTSAATSMSPRMIHTFPSPAPKGCRKGMERIKGTCVKKCGKGLTRKGTVCIMNCKPGFTFKGNTCVKICKKGYVAKGKTCILKCKKGFTKRGNECMKLCAKGKLELSSSCLTGWWTTMDDPFLNSAALF